LPDQLTKKITFHLPMEYYNIFELHLLDGLQKNFALEVKNLLFEIVSLYPN